MTMPGAVVISPPMGYSTKRLQVTKYHICALCWATKFYKLLDDGEFEISTQPPAIPLTVDEDLQMVEPTSMGLKMLWKRDPAIVEMDPEIDVMKILGRALWNKVEDDMTRYFAGLADNHIVEEYCRTDAELMEIMSKQPWFYDYGQPKKNHPIWDLLKRGWL